MVPPLRGFGVAVILGVLIGCGPEPGSLSDCESAEVKMALCETTTFPIDVCGAAGTETDHCHAACWYDAPCDELSASDPGDDVADCLDDCAGNGPPIDDEPRFQCDDGLMIFRSYLCDGRSDCRDGEDEAGC